jgi:hypothetical protein
MRRKERIGVVIDEDDEEEEFKEKPRWCEHCLTFELHMPLGPKRTEYGKVPDPDSDLFLECWHCGSIYPKYATKSEQALQPFAETTDNPFQDNKVFEAIPRRSSPAGKKAMEKRKRERNRLHHPDKEIDEAIRRYGEENVKIVEDTMRDAQAY